MMKNVSFSEWEALSAYLDNELPARERRRLENRLNEDPDLRRALEAIRQTRSLLRSQPKVRAPRNFTLTPQMVNVPKRRESPRFYPFLRLASAIATILFVLVFIGDVLTPPMAASPVAMEPQVLDAQPESMAMPEEPLPPRAGGAIVTEEAELLMGPPGEEAEERMLLAASTPTLEAEPGEVLDEEPLEVPAEEVFPEIAAVQEESSVEAVEGFGSVEDLAANEASEAEAPSRIDPITVAEITLGLIAVLTGLAAIFLRRRERI